MQKFSPREYNISKSFGTENWLSFRNHCIKHLTEDNAFQKKYRKKNYLKKLSSEIKKDFLNHSGFEQFSEDLIWHFELFYSIEPTGLHNDRNYFEELNEQCERGFVLPLKMKGEHSTEFYDIFIEQKVNLKGQFLANLEGDRVDCDLTELNSPTSLKWSEGQLVMFDAKQVHCSGNFDSSKEEFKISLNGLGYRKLKG